MILTGIVDRLHRLNHDLIVELNSKAIPTSDDGSSSARADKLEEGKELIAKISALKYQMGSNKDLAYEPHLIFAPIPITI